MQELIRAGRVYVAQPPLYMVTRKKKDEYVLNDRKMSEIYTGLGLDGTSLSIRDGDTGKDARTLDGEELRRVVELLQRLDELVRVVQRRGIDFAEFLSKRDNKGRLPIYRVVHEGEEHYFHDVADRDEFLSEHTAKDTGDAEAGAEEFLHLLKVHELHEVKDLEKLFTQLAQYGLLIDDYFLTQEESVTGEKLRTKYALVQDSKAHDVAGVAQLLPEIYKLGKQGIEVKRFKGLGEMNAEQLWETTLDPDRRVLLRVTLQEAGEAERLFSTLMGEDVERRRKFIEDHALEVKNLDV
jgi:DNA gyrase subunit B